MFQANHMGKAGLYDNQGGKMKKKPSMMLHSDPSILGTGQSSKFANYMIWRHSVQVRIMRLDWIGLGLYIKQNASQGSLYCNDSLKWGFFLNTKLKTDNILGYVRQERY